MASRRAQRRAASEGARPAAAASPGAPPSAASPPSPASLSALAAIAFAGALWSLLLWTELAGRAGTGTCLLGGSSCAALWNSPFAVGVHRSTLLPLAAWGLAWSLASFALPLTALLRRAEGRPDPALATGARLLGASGLLAVFVLVAVMLAARAFCAACSLMHALVAGYAGVVLFGWRRLGLPALRRGALLVAGSVLGAAAALVYPARWTPLLDSSASLPPLPDAAARSPAVSAGAPASPDEVTALVASLAPSLQQVLADSLLLYRVGPVRPLWPARGLQGLADAPVRVTEFTDVLCSHCAELFRTLRELRERLPPGSFSVEPRQFPLDATCNPLARGRLPDPVRCVAARALICMADDPRAEELAGILFANQRGLTAEKVYELAAPLRRRRDLQACVESPATGARLQEDVRLAAAFQPEGTPLVLVNGRKGTSFGPFLHAMFLTRGAPDHPAFAALPAPSANPHVH